MWAMMEKLRICCIRWAYQEQSRAWGRDTDKTPKWRKRRPSPRQPAKNKGRWAPLLRQLAILYGSRRCVGAVGARFGPAPRPGHRLTQYRNAYFAGSTATHWVSSPRRTSRPAALPLGSLSASLLKWAASDTSVLLTPSTMSPGCRPAASAVPSTLLTCAPPLMPSRFCKSAGTSTTRRPSALPADSRWTGASAEAVAELALSSPTRTDRVTVLPRRHTSISVRVPGLVSPTIRGRSDQRLIVSPWNEVMTSPGLTPASSAGPSASTLLTSAPSALGRPIASATSLPTSLICTPMRPRVTLPLSRD